METGFLKVPCNSQGKLSSLLFPLLKHLGHNDINTLRAKAGSSFSTSRRFSLISLESVLMASIFREIGVLDFHGVGVCGL